MHFDVLVYHNIVAKETIEEQMIAKLKYKQGLADFVLDANGDEETFAKPNARKAFLEQLKEIFAEDEAVLSGTASAKPKPKTPSPKEKLSAVIKDKADDLISCSIKITPPRIDDESDNGDSNTDKIASVLAVSSDPNSDSAFKCASALGIPQENVVTITPETQELLKKLEALGFLTLNRDAVIQQVETGMPSMPTEELLRRRRIKPLLELVDRKLQLAAVLESNNFIEEATAALGEGVEKMLCVFYVMNGAAKDESIEPITQHMLDAIASNGTFPQYLIDELIQSHQHANTIPETKSALSSARAFFA